MAFHVLCNPEDYVSDVAGMNVRSQRVVNMKFDGFI